MNGGLSFYSTSCNEEIFADNIDLYANIVRNIK